MLNLARSFHQPLTHMTTDRPSPRAERAQTIGLSKTTNNSILILSSIALSSALMKGTFFYLGNAKHIVPIIHSVLVSLGQATGKRGQSETNEFRSLRRRVVPVPPKDGVPYYVGILSFPPLALLRCVGIYR
jgi:hypothetical protein